MSATIADFHKWLEEVTGRFGSLRQKVCVVKNEVYGTSKDFPEEFWPYGSKVCYSAIAQKKPLIEHIYVVQIFTHHHQYTITAKCRPNQKGYLGCVVSNRTPRAGETWTRGADLADGPLSRSTWNKILGDILAYELIRIESEPMVKSDMISNPDMPMALVGSYGSCCQSAPIYERGEED